MSTTEPQFNDPPRPFGQYPLCIASLIKGRVCEAQPYTRLHWNGPSLIG